MKTENSPTIGGWVNMYGYREIRIDGKRYKLHRYLMEQYIGRKLEQWEDVHHIDGNKLNNDLSNLMIKAHGKHTSDHNLKRKYRKGYNSKISEDERRRRSDFMKKQRQVGFSKASLSKAEGNQI